MLPKSTSFSIVEQPNKHGFRCIYQEFSVGNDGKIHLSELLTKFQHAGIQLPDVPRKEILTYEEFKLLIRNLSERAGVDKS